MGWMSVTRNPACSIQPWTSSSVHVRMRSVSCRGSVLRLADPALDPYRSHRASPPVVRSTRLPARNSPGAAGQQRTYEVETLAGTVDARRRPARSGASVSRGAGPAQHPASRETHRPRPLRRNGPPGVHIDDPSRNPVQAPQHPGRVPAHRAWRRGRYLQAGALPHARSRRSGKPTTRRPPPRVASSPSEPSPADP